MSKEINAALLAHYQLPVTTLCYLLKITLRDGSVLGLTSLNVDFAYDDGGGEVTYQARIGADLSAVDTTEGLGVDNAESTMLLADSGAFSDQQIASGVLDYGEYVVYRVNWADPSMGHEIVDAGTTGIAKKVNGLAGVIELRSLQQTLKQTYGQLYSRTCRAKFGSGGGAASCAIQRGQCGFPADTLWQNHSVSAVDEDDRVFTADAPPAVNGPNGALAFAPGIVQWLTGQNAGAQSEVETVDGAGITLRFPSAWPIAVTDTFKIRPDCDKTWETCRDHYDNQLNFRGEPKIPLADEGSQELPNYSGTWAVNQVVDAETP